LQGAPVGTDAIHLDDDTKAVVRYPIGHDFNRSALEPDVSFGSFSCVFLAVHGMALVLIAEMVRASEEERTASQEGGVGSA
jgi:hypothetical protein